MVLSHLEAMAARFKKCGDLKDAPQARVSLNERERHKLRDPVPFLKDRVKELLVANLSSEAEVVAFSVERNSLTQSLAGRDAESEGFGVTADFVELLKRRMEQRKTSFSTTKEAPETQHVEADARPNATVTEMTGHRDRLCDEVGPLSSDSSDRRIDL